MSKTSFVEPRPATIHRCTGTSRYFLQQYEYWTSYRNIYDTFTYASTNMGKHCFQLVLILLPHFSPYARWLSEQADEKNPCWVVFSVIFKTRFVSRTDFWAHEQQTRQYPSCFVVISYRGKMYRCSSFVEPRFNHVLGTTLLCHHWGKKLRHFLWSF